MVYEKVSTNMNFVEREKKVEKFWQENDIFKKEDQKRFADLFRKLDAEIRTVPGGHVGFIVQAERYLDLMETFLQRNGI